MAQQGAPSTNNEPVSNTSKKQRPKPLEHQNSDSSRQLSSSELASNNYSLSPAERYINQRAQTVFDLTDSPCGTSSVVSNTSSNSHAEIMEQWRAKEINEIYQKEPHRYQYGPPPSSSNHQRKK